MRKGFLTIFLKCKMYVKLGKSFVKYSGIMKNVLV